MTADPFKSVFGSDRGQGAAQTAAPDFVVGELTQGQLAYLDGKHLASDIPCQWTPWMAPVNEDIKSRWVRCRENLHFSPQMGQQFLLNITALKGTYTSWPSDEIARMEKLLMQMGGQVIATVTEVNLVSERVAFIRDLGRFALVHQDEDSTLGVTITVNSEDHFFIMGFNQLSIPRPDEATISKISWNKLPKLATPGSVLYKLDDRPAKLVLNQKLVDDCREREDAPYVDDLQAALDSGNGRLQAQEIHADNPSLVHHVRLADGSECFGVEGDAPLGCVLDYPDGTKDAFYARANEFTLQPLDWVSEPASKLYSDDTWL